MTYFEELENIANEHFDGHYTVMKFTTNYRVAFGTLMAVGYDDLRSQIGNMPEGETLEAACKACIESGYSLYGQE